MTQLTEEQQERLKQIREIVGGPNYYHEGRFYKSQYDNYLLGDALLLLQECLLLLDSDSQAAGSATPTTPLLQKIVEIADIGSAQEFGDAVERLRSIRGLIVGENV